MSPQRRRQWLGVFGRYVVLVVILGLVATSLYAALDADDRPTVVRLAVAAFVTVVLIHIHSHFRHQLEGASPSPFAQAQRVPPVEAKVASQVQRLKEEVQAGVASHRYFKNTMW